MQLRYQEVNQHAILAKMTAEEIQGQWAEVHAWRGTATGMFDYLNRMVGDHRDKLRKCEEWDWDVQWIKTEIERLGKRNRHYEKYEKYMDETMTDIHAWKGHVDTERVSQVEERRQTIAILQKTHRHN